MIDSMNIELEEIKINTDVLVIGGGLAAMNIASEIADGNRNVVLVDAPKELEDNLTLLSLAASTDTKGIEVLSETQLVRVSGFSGDFQVKLSQGGEMVDRNVGAIVLATDLTVKPLADDFGLSLADNIVTPSQLEAKLADGKVSGMAVAFLTGISKDSNPLIMERLLDNVSKTLEAKDNTAYIFTDDLKVAGPGLDRTYRQTRDKGATYFKMKEKPAVSKDGKSIVFIDPVVGREIEIAVDMVVVEEQICANPVNKTLSDILNIDIDATEFLQLENVHRWTVNTNREGIFVAGPGRDIKNTSLLGAESASVALNIKALQSEEKSIPKTAVVDRDKCVICLTCYRCCPHGAITWDDKAVISAMACQGCGICASECPMDAIQIQDFSDQELKGKIQENLQAVDKGQSIIAFCCRNSALEAEKKAKEAGDSLPEGLRIIEVPCAGKIDVDYILSAFVEGAKGVMVLSCHEGNCKAERGNTFAGRRVQDVHAMMDDMGVAKDRLQFATLASNQGKLFSELVCEMEAKLNAL